MIIIHQPAISHNPLLASTCPSARLHKSDTGLVGHPIHSKISAHHPMTVCVCPFSWPYRLVPTASPAASQKSAKFLAVEYKNGNRQQLKKDAGISLLPIMNKNILPQPKRSPHDSFSCCSFLPSFLENPDSSRKIESNTVTYVILVEIIYSRTSLIISK
jgi:hypothetical protein